jgi:hypothetical protein
MIRVTCPRCNSPLKTTDNNAGKTFGCPLCGEPITLARAVADPAPQTIVVEQRGGFASTCLAVFAALFLFFIIMPIGCVLAGAGCVAHDLSKAKERIDSHSHRGLNN